MPELQIEEMRHSQVLGVYHSPTVPGLRTSDLGEHFPEFSSLSSNDRTIVLEVSEGKARTEAIILSKNIIYQFEHNSGGGYTVRRRFFALAEAEGMRTSSSANGSAWWFGTVLKALLISAVSILAIGAATLYQVHLLNADVMELRFAASSDVAGIPEKTFNYVNADHQRLARSADVSNVQNNEANAKAIYLLFKNDKNLLGKGETQVKKAVLDVLNAGTDGNRR